jgi:hypothetical protein
MSGNEGVAVLWFRQQSAINRDRSGHPTSLIRTSLSQTEAKKATATAFLDALIKLTAIKLNVPQKGI